MPIVFLAHESDVETADQSRALSARLISPRDLSRRGWQVIAPGTREPIAVTPRGRLRGDRVTGVVSRIVCVSPLDLPHIAGRDRAFAAREMTATLFMWLTSLGNRVLNTPTPRALCGEVSTRAFEALDRYGVPRTTGAHPARYVDVSLIGARTAKVHSRFACLSERLKSEGDAIGRLEAWAAGLPLALVRVRVVLEQGGWRALTADAVPELEGAALIRHLQARVKSDDRKRANGADLG